MKRIFYVLSLLAALAFSTQAQTTDKAALDSIDKRLTAVENLNERFTKISKYIPRLSGYIIAGYTYDESTSDIFVKCARIDINGNLSKTIDYRILFDFYNAKAYDVRMRFKPLRQLNFTIGHFKTPFSLSNGYGPLNESFISFPLAVTRLVGWNDVCGITGGSGRDIGASVWGTLLRHNGLNIIDYEMGVFNGNGSVFHDNNKTKDVSGRLKIQPVKGLILSGSYYWGEYGTEYIGRKRWAAGASYYGDLLFTRSEYIGGRTGSINSDGYYIMLGAKLPCKITPLFRFDSYTADDNVDNTQRNYTVGVDYKPFKFLRIQANYVVKTFSTGDSGENQFQLAITGTI